MRLDQKQRNKMIFDKVITQAHAYRGMPGLCRIEDFLDSKTADSYLTFAIQNEFYFTDLKQGYEGSHRSAKMLRYKDSMDSEIFIEIGRKIAKKARDIGYSDIEFMEIQLIASGNGDYFQRHRDFSHDLSKQRNLTYVYYLIKNSSKWEGGDLKFDNITVKPVHNQLIFFNPATFHEITKLECGSTWEESRFTFIGWFNRVKDNNNFKIGEDK